MFFSSKGHNTEKWDEIGQARIHPDHPVTDITFSHLDQRQDTEYKIRFDIALKDAAPDGLLCWINGNGNNIVYTRYLEVRDDPKTKKVQVNANQYNNIYLGGRDPNNKEANHKNRFMKGELFIESTNDLGPRRTVSLELIYGYLDPNYVLPKDKSKEYLMLVELYEDMYKFEVDHNTFQGTLNDYLIFKESGTEINMYGKGIIQYAQYIASLSLKTDMQQSIITGTARLSTSH